MSEEVGDQSLSEMDMFTLEMLSKPNKFKKMAQTKMDSRENPLFDKHRKHIQQTLQDLFKDYNNVCYGVGEQSLEVQELFVAIVNKIIRNREMQEEKEKFRYENEDEDEAEDDPDIFTNMDESSASVPSESSSFWGNKINKSRETIQYKKPSKLEPTSSLKSWVVPAKRDKHTLSDF